MLSSFGANITSNQTTATVQTAQKLSGQKVIVPGDISSAAYFLVAGLITPNSCITVKNVGINPTRDGILEVIKNMGGKISFSNEKTVCGERSADITVMTSSLKGCTIEGSIIPRLIDEIPIIAILACFADGKTVIKDAQELKVKESNRIDVMVNALSSMGADIIGTDDGMIIQGGKPLHGAVIDSHLDHRIAMSFAVAAGVSQGETEITGAECVNISYPDFYKDLIGLQN
jgi:3-phosphoshikimate 1-carboxyvinyltransferase